MDPSRTGPIVLDNYEKNLKSSWLWDELWKIRNFRPSFERWGLYGGTLYSGIDTLFLRGRAPFTLKHGKPDYDTLKPASQSYERPSQSPAHERVWPHGHH